MPPQDLFSYTKNFNVLNKQVLIFIYFYFFFKFKLKTSIKSPTFHRLNFKLRKTLNCLDATLIKSRFLFLYIYLSKKNEVTPLNLAQQRQPSSRKNLQPA